METSDRKQRGVTREALENILKSKAKNNRVSCRTAFELASELGVTPLEVGEALNRLKIKIVGCQLGCF